MTGWPDERPETFGALLLPPVLLLVLGARGVAVIVIWAVITAVLWMLIVCALPDARWRSERVAVVGVSSIVGALAAGWLIPV